MRDPKLTRRFFIRRTVAATGLITLSSGTAFGVGRLLSGAGLGPLLPSFTSGLGQTALSYVSQPDLHPVSVSARPAAPDDYLFLGPGANTNAKLAPLIVGAPLIIDKNAETVWYKPLPSNAWATNVKVAEYRDNPALTWWQGTVVDPGYGKGVGVIVDGSYRPVATVQGANGRQLDLHEFTITPQGTALFTCFPAVVPGDLSAMGGPTDGQVLDSIIQEVDIRTGRLLFEWRSLDHVPITESYRPPEEPYDYFHANSVEVLPDGNLLVSGRHTWTIYKVDRRTGEIIWRLGGKRSDFAMGPGAQFSWQHDARQLHDGLFTVFDNGSDGIMNSEPQSRGLMLGIDSRTHTVSVRRAYYHPSPLSSISMGNVQMLPGGNVLVGWGSQHFVSEFTAEGKLVADVQMPAGQQCYRGYRQPWTAVPTETPALSSRRDTRSGRSTLYASWNGATTVAYWRVHLGTTPRELRPVGVAHRRGFETAIPVDRRASVAAVTALDGSGRELARSEPVQL